MRVINELGLKCIKTSNIRILDAHFLVKIKKVILDKRTISISPQFVKKNPQITFFATLNYIFSSGIYHFTNYKAENCLQLVEHGLRQNFSMNSKDSGFGRLILVTSKGNLQINSIKIFTYRETNLRPAGNCTH